MLFVLRGLLFRCARTRSSTAHDAGGIEQFLQTVLRLNPVPVPQDIKSAISIEMGGPALDPNSASAAVGAGQGAHGFAQFDAAAQQALIGFLQNNPNFQVNFDHDNVVVYDGQNDPGLVRPVTIQIWEFNTGATIAIVGHVNQPEHT